MTDIQPAGIDQVQQGSSGRMHVIDADVGGVVRDLQRLDPCLKVRFAEDADQPFFVVRWESADGRHTYLVKTVQAFLNRSGTWEGLDQRLVRELERIDPEGRGDYNYADELAKRDEANRRAKRAAFQEKMAETSEVALAAVQRDLGVKRRVFVP